MEERCQETSDRAGQERSWAATLPGNGKAPRMRMNHSWAVTSPGAGCSHKPLTASCKAHTLFSLPQQVRLNTRAPGNSQQRAIRHGDRTTRSHSHPQRPATLLLTMLLKWLYRFRMGQTYLAFVHQGKRCKTRVPSMWDYTREVAIAKAAHTVPAGSGEGRTKGQKNHPDFLSNELK